MKKLICALAILSLGACASSKKEAETAANNQVEQVKAEGQSMVDAAKTEVEKTVEAAKETAGKAVDTATSAMSFEDYVGAEDSKITCSAGEDVRTVSVLNGETGGCGVVYNKHGQSKTVAVAKYNADYCSTVQNKIKANLESQGGFSCQ